MTELTAKVIAYLGHKEGLVLEMYKDSVGVNTWALGVTDASGHKVGRYKDAPTSIEKALEISVWLIKEKYFPAVAKAFPSLNEAQTAAALSFHWNTGAISRLKGNFANASQWRKPPELIPRRKEEQDLWNGKWPSDLRVPIYGVNKPSYNPNFKKRQLIDIEPLVGKFL
jgi:lysozyme